MPFGLVSACSSYLRLMRTLLTGIPNVSFYFDNVYIYGKTWEEHTIALRAVLERLRDHGLTAKPVKCRFGFPFIMYLGFIVDGATIRPQVDKINAIVKMTAPRSKTNLRSFLGMVSFYGKFIPNISNLTGPMTDMLKKGVKEPLVWAAETLENFDKLKLLLSSDPILRVPDPSLPFVLRTDASNIGVGAILMQYFDGIAFPIAYASRKLLVREQAYSTVERECLALIFGIKKFEFYLIGQEFLLEVDHKPLVYMEKFKGSNDKLLRWSLGLQPYRFRLVHIPGCDNIGADLLSRAECDE